MDTYPLARPLPPWPGVLPLSEAAAVLGMKPDTLQKRVTRRQQPSLLRGGRRQVVLLPHQWATWARSYQPPAVGRTPPRAESASPRTGTELGLAEVLHRLERLEAVVAAQAEEIAALREREARPSPPQLPPADSPRSDTGSDSWWRRFLASIGIPLEPAAPRGRPPQSR